MFLIENSPDKFLIWDGQAFLTFAIQKKFIQMFLKIFQSAFLSYSVFLGFD